MKAITRLLPRRSLWGLLAAKQETLLRMNPVTLAVTGALRVTSGQYLGNYGNHLSVAGGALWAVAGNRLVRVSLRTGKAEKVVDLPAGSAPRWPAARPARS